SVRVPVGGGSDGTIKLNNGPNASTHLIVDVVGYYDGVKATEAGRYIALPPERVVDTRFSGSLPNGLPPNSILQLLAGNPPPPGTFDSLLLNVTATGPTGSG